MGLLPRFRPRIGLHVRPMELMAGGMMELFVSVDAPRPRKVTGVDLWLEQSVRTSRGVGSRFRLHAPLSGPRALDEGRTEFTSTARIPASALPDHRGQRVVVSTVARVVLGSRWLFDVKRSFQLRVRGSAYGGAVEPLLFSSRVAGRDDPYLEGSLDRSVLRPGGMLSGRVAAAGADCRKLEVHLVATETDGQGPHPSGRWRLRVNRELKAGESVPFAMSIPADVTPSFRTGRAALGWAVELQADRAFARDLTLRIPVTVALGSDEPEPLTEAPMVGNERIAALWQRMAQHTGTTFDGGALRDRIGEVELTVRPGAEGIEARLTFPTLGIDLEGGEREGLRRVTGRGKVPALGERWNRLFYASAREPAQAQVFLARALGRLVAVRFHAADDEGLTLAIDAPHDDGSELERMVRLARRVAERIPDAAEAMPMPGGLDRDGWERAAEALEARLSPGPPRLRATDGAWTIDTRWPEEGEPFTRLSAGARTPIDERFHTGSTEELPEALSRDARPLAEWLAREGRLHIAADEVALELPGLTEEPATLEPAIDRIGRLLRLLRVDDGPYR